MLPASSIYGYAFIPEKVKSKEIGNPVFDASVEATVFSMDIQKAIPGITAIYLNDFYVAGGYAGTGTAGSATEGGFQTSKLGDYFQAVFDGRGHYLDSIYAKVGLELTPNIGVLAQSGMKSGIFLVYSYTFNSIGSLKMNEHTKISIGFDLNY